MILLIKVKIPLIQGINLSCMCTMVLVRNVYSLVAPLPHHLATGL